MSWTTSARLSRGRFGVAIAGSTGRLGSVIASTFLSEYKSFFRVVCLTRNETSPNARALASQGAEVKGIPQWTEEGLKSALQDIDILVGALSGSASGGEKEVLLRSALAAGVQVYFPSEYGVDHRANDFPGFDHEDWLAKGAHAEHARELAAGKMKVVVVFTGWFLELGLAPLAGFDIPNRLLTPVGPPSQRVSFTSQADVARALAELSLLASQPSSASKVPDHVRIAGSTASFEDVARWCGGEVRTQSLDLAREKAELSKRYLADRSLPPAGHLRILMGEGKLDWSSSNDNELVNPDQSVWKWKTVKTQVEEILKS